MVEISLLRGSESSGIERERMFTSAAASSSSAVGTRRKKRPKTFSYDQYSMPRQLVKIPMRRGSFDAKYDTSRKNLDALEATSTPHDDRRGTASPAPPMLGRGRAVPA